MAKREILEKKSLTHLLKAASHLVRLPQTHVRLDYDEDADVLYLHFDDDIPGQLIAKCGATASSWITKVAVWSGSQSLKITRVTHNPCEHVLAHVARPKLST